jgi:hypothetical protein
MKRTSVTAARTDARSRSREMVASVSGRQERYEKRQRCVDAEEEKEAPKNRQPQRHSTERAPKASSQRRVRIEAASPEEESKTDGLVVKEYSSLSTFVQGTPPGGRCHRSLE